MSRACCRFLSTFVTVLALVAASVSAQQKPASAKPAAKPAAAKPAASRPAAAGLTNADILKMVRLSTEAPAPDRRTPSKCRSTA